MNGIKTIINSFKDWHTFSDGQNQKLSAFRVPQFDAKSWLNHFLYITSARKIGHLIFRYPDGIFDGSQTQVAVDCLTGLEIMHLETEPVQELDKLSKLINKFADSKILTISYLDDPLDLTSLVPIRQTLSLNFPQIYVSVEMELDDLLLTRSSSIGMIGGFLTDDDLNVFLKHWIAGLKPELENFALNTAGDF